MTDGVVQRALEADQAGRDAPDETTASGRWPWLRLSPELLVFFFLIGLCVVMFVLDPRFGSIINVQNIGRQTAVLLVLAVGVLFVLLVGGIDLSLAGTIGLTSVAAAHFADEMPASQAFALAAGVGLAIGLTNGLLVAVGRFSPIVVTVAMGQVLTGFALLATPRGPIQPGNPGYADIAISHIGPVPTLVVAAAVCLVAAHLVLTRLSFGRYVYAVGGNRTAAWLSGVPTAKVTVGAYTICGLFASLAAILLSTRVGSGEASLGATVWLSAYAAAFIGGVGFGTGRGTVIGVALGGLVLGVISNGIDLAGLDSDWQFIISGSLILLAIAMQVLPGRLRGTGGSP